VALIYNKSFGTKITSAGLVGFARASTTSPRNLGKLIPDHLQRLLCLDEMTKEVPQWLLQAWPLALMIVHLNNVSTRIT